MKALLDSLTLEQKVGQLFLIRCPQENEAQAIACFQPAGLVLFSVDFENRTAEEVRARIAGMQESSPLPLLISADEEGGTVCRVSRQSALRDKKFPSPRELYAAGGWEAVEQDAREKAALLQDLGLNVNLAPVCDISDDPAHFIYPRAISGDGKMAADFVRRVVTISEEMGVGTVLKHFPGYGNNADTHTGVAIDKRPYETFEQSDFLPFRAGMGAGAPFVLVSHNVVECMDAALPASLSPAVHEVLRETLGFDGIVITDDLAMDAVKQYANGEAAVLAVLAGNDMLITSDYQNDIPAVLAAVADGRIAEREIDAHVLRILRYKQAQGWIE